MTYIAEKITLWSVECEQWDMRMPFVAQLGKGGGMGKSYSKHLQTPKPLSTLNLDPCCTGIVNLEESAKEHHTPRLNYKFDLTNYIPAQSVIYNVR